MLRVHSIKRLLAIDGSSCMNSQDTNSNNEKYEKMLL